MNQKKTILVIGATGEQGGSVAKALLAENNFAVRILTRNKQSQKAITLQQAGAELVIGDLDNIQSIMQAMKGCYGVFGVTDFWEHFDDEYQLGKNLIHAVKQMKIQHFVFSTSPGYDKLSDGKYPVPQCDIKAVLQQYATSLNIPTTFMHVAFYFENFLNLFTLQRTGNDS